MADILATLFRFRQFVFEYGPFFLAAWFGLAVITGLVAAAQRKWIGFKVPSISFLQYWPLRLMWRLLFFGLWRPRGKMPTPSAFNGLLLFSLIVPVPALVATSLIGMEAVWLRLTLASLFALSLDRFVTSMISRKSGNFREQSPEEMEVVSQSGTLQGGSSGLRSLAQVTWRSFIGQVEGAVIPLIVGFSLASILSIYVPAYTVRSWLGEGVWQGPYLAALLAIPFQLTGGADVLLASALLVKGASLGTSLSVMLVAPSTTLSVIRYLYRPVKLQTMALYLVAAWLIAGSLGVAVDGIQRLFSG